MNDNFDFSYRITTVNIEQGTVEIEYIPDDLDLSPYKVNQFLLPRYPHEILDGNGQQIYSTMEEIPIEQHILNTIKVTAPLVTWRKQRILLENYDYLDKHSDDKFKYQVRYEENEARKVDD